MWSVSQGSRHHPEKTGNSIWQLMSKTGDERSAGHYPEAEKISEGLWRWVERNHRVRDALVQMALAAETSWSTEKTLSLKERGTGWKPLWPTDGAAGTMALNMCQFPPTHALAALWHCVEVPASQCGHMSVIQACGSEEERTLRPMNPFYELPMADTISSSVGSLSAKGFKRCNVQLGTVCKEAQSH